MKKTLIIILLLSGLTLSNNAQTLNKLKLDSLFDRLMAKDKAMGSICISKNGTVLYRRAIGYSLITESEKKEADIRTKYRIGSITKMFTATMVMQLVEEGKLTLSDNLNAYFPFLPNADQITISNLLNHRSGLHNFTDDSGYLKWMTQTKTHEEILAIISKSKADFKPNEDASYSNTNYVVLGYIIEKITGQSYANNLKERITSKIGLTNTDVGSRINADNNESFSYRFSGTWKKETETDMSVPGGAGIIISTPTDLTLFIESLFNLKLISKNSLLQMKTLTDGYGMGMFQFPFGSKKAYGHTGGIDGFSSILGYFPEDSLAIAYTTNGQEYPYNDIIIGALSIYFNKPYKIPEFKTLALSTGELDKYVGVYSSAQLPLKITIKRDGKTLTAQATGQSSFPLEPVGRDQFKFDQVGVEFEFNQDKKEMVMKQGAGTYLFTKDK